MRKVIVAVLSVAVCYLFGWALVTLIDGNTAQSFSDWVSSIPKAHQMGAVVALLGGAFVYFIMEDATR